MYVGMEGWERDRWKNLEVVERTERLNGRGEDEAIEVWWKRRKSQIGFFFSFPFTQGYLVEYYTQTQFTSQKVMQPLWSKSLEPSLLGVRMYASTLLLLV